MWRGVISCVFIIFVVSEGAVGMRYKVDSAVCGGVLYVRQAGAGYAWKRAGDFRHSGAWWEICKHLNEFVLFSLPNFFRFGLVEESFVC